MFDLPILGPEGQPRFIDLSGLPWGSAHLILCSLRNENCSPDLVLVLADALRELLTHLDTGSIYSAPIQRTEAALRDLAPLYATHPRPAAKPPGGNPLGGNPLGGKPLGDFDGTLTPDP